MQVLFIQGAGDHVHDDWDSKLVASLERHLDQRVRYPRMPHEDDPQLATWQPVILRELESLHDGDLLVGHSVGGSVLFRTLAAHPPAFRPRALVLIAAPFVGEGGWPGDGPPTPPWRATFPVVLYHGTADDTVPTAHAQLYARAIPHATVHLLADRDHQLNDDLGDVARDLRSADRKRENPP